MATNPFLAGQQAARGQNPVPAAPQRDLGDVVKLRAFLNQQQQAMADRAREEQQRALANEVQQRAVAGAPEDVRDLVRTPEGFEQYVKSRFATTKPVKWQTVGSDKTGYYQVHPETGEKRSILDAAPGDANPELTASMRMRAQKIQDTMRLQGVDEASATAIVDGQVRAITDPVSGDSMLVNMATRQVIPVDVPRESLPMVGDADDLSGKNLSAEEMSQGTGAAATVKDVLAKTAGQIFPELVDAQSTEASQAIKQIRNRLVPALSISGRPPVIEQERILELLPNTGVFESPERARTVLNSLKRELQRQANADAQAYNDKLLPASEEAGVLARRRELLSIVDQLDGIGGGDPAKPATSKRIRFDAEGNIIE